MKRYAKGFAGATVLMVLAGCLATTSDDIIWTHPQASQQRYDMDRGQCQAQAFSVPGAPAMQMFAVFASCMRGKGWTPERPTATPYQAVSPTNQANHQCGHGSGPCR